VFEIFVELETIVTALQTFYDQNDYSSILYLYA